MDGLSRKQGRHAGRGRSCIRHRRQRDAAHLYIGSRAAGVHESSDRERPQWGARLDARDRGGPRISDPPTSLFPTRSVPASAEQARPASYQPDHCGHIPNDRPANDWRSIGRRCQKGSATSASEVAHSARSDDTESGLSDGRDTVYGPRTTQPAVSARVLCHARLPARVGNASIPVCPTAQGWWTVDVKRQAMCRRNARSRWDLFGTKPSGEMWASRDEGAALELNCRRTCPRL